MKLTAIDKAFAVVESTRHRTDMGDLAGLA